MWENWTNYLLPKALKSCPKSNKLPNLVTLIVTSEGSAFSTVGVLAFKAVIIDRPFEACVSEPKEFLLQKYFSLFLSFDT